MMAAMSEIDPGALTPDSQPGSVAESSADATVTDVVQVVTSPSVATPPARKPKKLTRTLRAGDTPHTVAMLLYGRPSAAHDLVRANPSVSWQVGEKIDLLPSDMS
jgi:hypothetical protein